MNKLRLEALSDGVFAIVMTLLVIEIKVPESHGIFKEGDLIADLQNLIPLFLSFFLSFAVLTSYWITHNFLLSVTAKNADRYLAYLNLLFLSFVSLIPFSSHLLGEYPTSQSAVMFYSTNVLVIGLILFGIREYISRSPKIENPDLSSINFTKKDRLYGTARLILTIASSILAIVFSYFNTYASLLLILIPVVIGIVPNLLAFIMKITALDRIVDEVEEQEAEIMQSKK